MMDIDWITLGIFAGFFMTGLSVGLVVGIPAGQRHILEQYARRANEERKAYLADVKRRANDRLNQASAGVRNRRSYGVLDAEELS